MEEQRAWIRARRKKRLRLLAAALVFGLLFTTYPNVLETLSVSAAGTQDGDDTVYVDGFAELPDKEEISAPEKSSAGCGLCHICPTFQGICYFIWLAGILIAIFLFIWIVIRGRERKK